MHKKHIDSIKAGSEPNESAATLRVEAPRDSMDVIDNAIFPGQSSELNAIMEEAIKVARKTIEAETLKPIISEETDFEKLLQEEATAAGLTGAGGRDGNAGFVRLLRVNEDVTPLAYQYDLGTEDTIAFRLSEIGNNQSIVTTIESEDQEDEPYDENENDSETKTNEDSDDNIDNEEESDKEEDIDSEDDSETNEESKDTEESEEKTEDEDDDRDSTNEEDDQKEDDEVEDEEETEEDYPEEESDDEKDQDDSEDEETDPDEDDTEDDSDDGDDPDEVDPSGPKGNNGWGNGDQDAPGNSANNNNAENNTSGKEDPTEKRNDNTSNSGNNGSSTDPTIELGREEPERNSGGIGQNNGAKEESKGLNVEDILPSEDNGPSGNFNGLSELELELLLNSKVKGNPHLDV